MSSTDPDLRTAWVPFDETKRRLEELTRLMPASGRGGEPTDDEALAMRAAIQRVERGTK